MELLIDLFKRTNLEGEPYSDVVFDPKKLSFPNIPINEIFDRFENNVEKLSHFYLIRNARWDNNSTVLVNRQKDVEFVDKLINQINEQPTTFELNLDMKHDWPAMFLGCFKSNESFKLMNVICSTIKNNVSTLDIDDIDAESLKLLNKTILQKDSKY